MHALLIFLTSLHHAWVTFWLQYPDAIFFAGLPIGLGGSLTQGTLQGLATWDGGGWSTLAIAGNTVLTAAQMVAGSTTFLTLTGAPGGGFNLTTPSAAALIAQYTQAYGTPPTVGSTWIFEISNTTGQTATLVAGAGVTINGTATVATTVNRSWLVTVTNSSSGPQSGQAALTLQNISSRSN